MKNLLRTGILGLSLYITAAIAQQQVPFNFGIPLAPEGLANQPLGDGPLEFKTGEDMDIRVVVLTQNIAFPLRDGLLAQW